MVDATEPVAPSVTTGTSPAASAAVANPGLPPALPGAAGGCSGDAGICGKLTTGAAAATAAAAASSVCCWYGPASCSSCCSTCCSTDATGPSLTTCAVLPLEAKPCCCCCCSSSPANVATGTAGSCTEPPCSGVRGWVCSGAGSSWGTLEGTSPGDSESDGVATPTAPEADLLDAGTAATADRVDGAVASSDRCALAAAPSAASPTLLLPPLAGRAGEPGLIAWEPYCAPDCSDCEGAAPACTACTCPPIARTAVPGTCPSCGAPPPTLLSVLLLAALVPLWKETAKLSSRGGSSSPVPTPDACCAGGPSGLRLSGNGGSAPAVAAVPLRLDRCGDAPCGEAPGAAATAAAAAAAGAIPQLASDDSCTAWATCVCAASAGAGLLEPGGAVAAVCCDEDWVACVRAVAGDSGRTGAWAAWVAPTAAPAAALRAWMASSTSRSTAALTTSERTCTHGNPPGPT